MRNLITDVPGVLVGNAHDDDLVSGVSAVVFEAPAIASVDVRGGAPGTRETDLLGVERTVEQIDAIVLAGGSAFGLDAASGAMAALAAKGRGLKVGDARIPIVPSAILFDLLNGGNKTWGDAQPYRDMGITAINNAGADFLTGTYGAGTGATTANLKGGLGSASARTSFGATVGALVAVNAVGSVTMGDRPYFWASQFEEDEEFGGKGAPSRITPEILALRVKSHKPGEATTIAVIATDAILTKAQARHLAVMAQDGMARAVYPAHTPLDGDTVFAAATGRVPLPDPHHALAELGLMAANVLARAIARGVYEADGSGRGAKNLPSYHEQWG